MATGNLIITTAGFSVYPGSAPPGWPSTVVWPPTGSTVFNVTHTAPVSDADMLSIMAWAAATQFGGLGQPTTPVSITTNQLHNAFVQFVFSNLKAQIQRLFTTPPVVPPPITLT